MAGETSVPQPFGNTGTVLEKTTRDQYVFWQRKTSQSSASGTQSWSDRYRWHQFHRTVSVVATRYVFASVDDADTWRQSQTPPSSGRIEYSAARRINELGWAELISTLTVYSAWEDEGELPQATSGSSSGQS